MCIRDRALQDMIPGFYGYYFMNHFMPYLQIRITTPEQQTAYENIIAFWDNAEIKIPLFMKVVSYLMYRLTPKPTLDQMTMKMDAQLKKYVNSTEEDYVKLREQTRKNVKLKNLSLIHISSSIIPPTSSSLFLKYTYKVALLYPAAAAILSLIHI